MARLEELDKNSKFCYTSKRWSPFGRTYWLNGMWYYLSIANETVDFIEKLDNYNLTLDDYIITDTPNPAYRPKVSLKEIYANY